MHPTVLSAAVGVWFFVLGSAIGSFLNVVVYRMPRGMSITGRSHCPRCGKAIAFYDNIPVFGWLLLRGRCRQCRGPISLRYPLVELTVGLLFVLLLLVELRSGGANLPQPLRQPYDALFWIVHQPYWPLIAVYSYHCWLLVLLLGIGLIAMDGQRLPAKLVVFALVVGLAAPALWPALHPVPWWSWQAAGPPDRQWTGGLGTAAVGLLAGGFIGGTVGLIGRRRGAAAQTAVAVGLVGLHLGWQAALSSSLIALGLCVMLHLLARMTGRPSKTFFLLCLFAGTAVQLCCWSQLHKAAWWPARCDSPAALVLAAAAAAVLALLLRAVRQRRETEEHKV